MSQAVVDSHNPYFFHQKKDQLHQRRLRKGFDDFSIFGERREPHLFFSGADAESIVSGPAYRRRRAQSAVYRPGSATRRVSIAEPPVLPPVDPTGPNLVSGEALDALETKSTLSENKISLLQSIEEKDSAKPLERVHLYKFSEAKFASSSILSSLGKILYTVSDDFIISIPLELVNALTQTHPQLTAGTVVEKREWQTDCYFDLPPKNQHPFLTRGPEDLATRERLKATLSDVARRERNKRGEEAIEKRVRLNTGRGTMTSSTKRSLSSPERPLTARSVLSNFSFKSESSADDRESRYEYDMLPAELRPTALHYRRETQTPKLRVTGPKTRLEKFKMVKGATAEMKARSKCRVVCVHCVLHA